MPAVRAHGEQPLTPSAGRDGVCQLFFAVRLYIHTAKRFSVCPTFGTQQTRSLPSPWLPSALCRRPPSTKSSPCLLSHQISINHQPIGSNFLSQQISISHSQPNRVIWDDVKIPEMGRVYIYIYTQAMWTQLAQLRGELHADWSDRLVEPV